MGELPPARISLAIKCLYAVLGIAVLRLLWTVVSHIEVRSPWLLISSTGLRYGIFAFLVFKLSQHKSWARMGLVIIFVLSIPLNIIPMMQSVGHSPVVNGLGLIQLVLYALALFWLYQAETRAWFAN
jgi:hypothetical protein